MPQNDHIIEVSPIGWVESVFKEKFGAPRQSGVVPSAEGRVHFYSPYDVAEAFVELQGFSHLWLITQFHLTPPDESFRPKVRPPKLGGEKKVGVFASRAPYRPNRLCLTKVKLEEVVEIEGKVQLRISGLDLVQGTPVLDVKPYLPYADSEPQATMSFGLPPVSTPVTPEDASVFSGLTEQEITLIEQALQAQPQPAYAKPDQFYGITLGEMNVRWHFCEDDIIVTQVEKE